LKCSKDTERGYINRLYSVEKDCRMKDGGKFGEIIRKDFGLS